MIGFMISALLFPFIISKIDVHLYKFITLGIIGSIATTFAIALKISKKKVSDG